MGNSVHVRTIESGDQPAVDELHREHYWRSNCLLLNQDFYRWQFLEAPGNAGAGGDQSVVAVDEDGRLLSYLGVIRAEADFRGRPINAAHLITWLSSPASRGRGVGLQLMTYMTQNFDFLFGRSVTPGALAIYRRLGFRYFPTCSRWIAVLDPEATLQLAVDPAETGAKRAGARVVPENQRPSSYSRMNTPPDSPELVSSALEPTGFRRTRDFLTWRYEKHPYFRYSFLATGNVSHSSGFAVVRVEDVSGRPGRVLRVVEFVANPEHGKELAGAVFSYGRQQGCAFADCFGMSEAFVSGFVAAGGFSVAEEPELRLPHLFQPWDPDIDPPGLLFFGRGGRPGLPTVGPADDISRIHVSKGDGNMDWPSWSPEIEGGIAPSTRTAADAGR